MICPSSFWEKIFVFDVVPSIRTKNTLKSTVGTRKEIRKHAMTTPHVSPKQMSLMHIVTFRVKQICAFCVKQTYVKHKRCAGSLPLSIYMFLGGGCFTLPP